MMMPSRLQAPEPTGTVGFTHKLWRSAGNVDLLQLIAEPERDVSAVRRPDDALRSFGAGQHPCVEALQVADPESNRPVRAGCGERQRGWPSGDKRHVGLERRVRWAARSWNRIGSAVGAAPAASPRLQCLPPPAAPTTVAPLPPIESGWRCSCRARSSRGRASSRRHPLERMFDLPRRLPSLVGILLQARLHDAIDTLRRRRRTARLSAAADP